MILRSRLLHSSLVLSLFLHYFPESDALSSLNPRSSSQRRQESIDVGHNPLLSLNLNLDALARARAPERAQELYHRITALHEEGYYAVQPDTCSFNSVLKAWQDSPAEALAFWESQKETIEPNIRSYNTILLAMARGGMSESAEELLRQLQDSDLTMIVPDRITYNTVLLAYATSGGETSLEKSENILQEMMDSDYVNPDFVTMNTILTTCLAQSPQSNAAAKAEEWLSRMIDYGIDPDVYSYTSMINAWADLGETKQARFWLDKMVESLIPPNQVTYTSLMKAHCLKGEVDEAEDILEEMKELQKKSPDVRPDCVTYSVLISGWSRVASKRPNDTYAAVTRLLEEMNSLGTKWPDILPNQQTYTSVLTALARTGHNSAAKRAETYLAEMESSGLRPSVIHYNAVLNAHAKSPRVDKTLRAALLLEGMSVAPDTISYNSVLAAASSTFGKVSNKINSLKIALKAFSALRADESCQPTSLSYYYLTKAIRRLLPSQNSAREKLIQKVFHLCCDDGCLNDRILRQISSQLTRKETKLLLPKDYTGAWRVKDMPQDWSKHSLS